MSGLRMQANNTYPQGTSMAMKDPGCRTAQEQGFDSIYYLASTTPEEVALLGQRS